VYVFVKGVTKSSKSWSVNIPGKRPFQVRSREDIVRMPRRKEIGYGMETYTGLNWRASAIVNVYFPVKHKDFLCYRNVFFFLKEMSLL